MPAGLNHNTTSFSYIRMLPITRRDTREEETENTHAVVLSSFFSPNREKNCLADICDNALWQVNYTKSLLKSES